MRHSQYYHYSTKSVSLIDNWVPGRLQDTACSIQKRAVRACCSGVTRQRLFADQQPEMHNMAYHSLKSRAGSFLRPVLGGRFDPGNRGSRRLPLSSVWGVLPRVTKLQAYVCIAGRLGLAAYSRTLGGDMPNLNWGVVADRSLDHVRAHNWCFINGITDKSRSCRYFGNDLWCLLPAAGKPAADPVVEPTALAPVACASAVSFSSPVL